MRAESAWLRMCSATLVQEIAGAHDGYGTQPALMLLSGYLQHFGYDLSEWNAGIDLSGRALRNAGSTVAS